MEFSEHLRKTNFCVQYVEWAPRVYFEVSLTQKIFFDTKDLRSQRFRCFLTPVMSACDPQTAEEPSKAKQELATVRKSESPSSFNWIRFELIANFYAINSSPDFSNPKNTPDLIQRCRPNQR